MHGPRIPATQLCSANAMCEETNHILLRNARKRRYMPDRDCGGHFPGPQEGPIGSAREGMVDVYPALSSAIFVPACRLPLPKKHCLPKKHWK
ncbi:unnamed protein product [Ectocarpus sp. 6 AP-2014]